MKKLMFAAFVAATSLLPALAEGEPAMNTTSATQMMTDIKTGLETVLTAAGPLITGLILSGVGIWAVFAVVRLMKRAFNSGK